MMRGWLPDFLPESSYAIHVVYQIDSSRTWCAFNFSPHASLRMQNVLTASVREVPLRVRCIDDPDVRWWPKFLRGNLDIEQIYRNGFVLYIYKEPSIAYQSRLLLFIIDWTDGRGYFYRTYSR
jgi:hypothetical protein